MYWPEGALQGLHPYLISCTVPDLVTFNAYFRVRFSIDRGSEACCRDHVSASDELKLNAIRLAIDLRFSMKISIQGQATHIRSLTRLHILCDRPRRPPSEYPRQRTP